MTLKHKSRLVKNYHKTPQTEWSTFAGVLLRKIIRIALTYAALNDLPVFGDDIQNAYLQAPSSKKITLFVVPNFANINHSLRFIWR